MRAAARSALAAAALLALAVAAAALPLSRAAARRHHVASAGTVRLAESIPTDLKLTTALSTHDAWMQMIGAATTNISIAAFYMTLTDGSQYPSWVGGQLGQDIYNGLILAAKRGVHVSIILNEPSSSMPDTDAYTLAQQGYATLTTLDWEKIVGSGIVHTKLITVDGLHAYIGSANIDWRSLAQVKELGAVFMNAPDVAHSADQIIGEYYYMAQNGKVANPWPDQYQPTANMQNLGYEPLNGISMPWYMDATPAALCPSRRTFTLDSIVALIGNATDFVRIQTMDYLPTTLYLKDNVYWGPIDDAIRDAAFRGVKVQMLIAKWNHTDPSMMQYLISLDALDNVDVRLFIMPPLQGADVPFTRVNHAKFMVTEDAAYISTQNWTGDYFLTTGGAAIVLPHQSMIDDLSDVFQRDWTSVYSQPLPSSAQ